jgi:hypothetical protein
LIEYLFAGLEYQRRLFQPINNTGKYNGLAGAGWLYHQSMVHSSIRQELNR